MVPFVPAWRKSIDFDFTLHNAQCPIACSHSFAWRHGRNGSRGDSGQEKSGFAPRR
jgi:hypothetical protein